MRKTEYKKSICPLDCPDSCGLVATIVDGRVVSLVGDGDHPVTNGFICRKMRRYPERCYSPQRVMYPAVRVGAKGKGEFRRIDWDEALEIMAVKLAEIRREYGSEAILPYSYAGNMGAVNRFAGYPFFNRLGTSRLDQTICSAAAGVGWRYHCGDLPGTPPENSRDADLVVVWGMNVKVTNIHFWQYVAAAGKRGGRLLVVDPYNNVTARSADIYQPVKAGGDSGLALGIIKAVISLDLVDHNFIQNHTDGFGMLAAYLRNTDWGRFEKISGVTRPRMEELARLFAASAKTFIRIGIGMTRNSRGAMAVRAITSLGASLGLFSGGPGRGVFLTSGAFKGDKQKLTYPDLSCQKRRLVNMVQLGHALTALKPEIKALFVYNSNPLTVNPDATMVKKGLGRDDLFTVVHEQVMTPTARYADLLLPATTFLENTDVYTSYGHFYMGIARPVIEPVGEGWSNFDLFQKLARKMGFNEAPFLQSCEERIEDYLQNIEGMPDGIDIQQIMNGKLVRSALCVEDGRMFVCHGGKFRFAATGGAVDIQAPTLIPAGEYDNPDLRSRFPFRLITPPHIDLLNSTFGERFFGKFGEVIIHPEDAAVYGINDGSMVVLENFRGRVVRRARISSDTQRGLLVAEGLFWGDGDGSGINNITSQNITDMGRGGVFHESLVSLVKK